MQKRKSNQPEAAEALVEQFLDVLEGLVESYQEEIPQYFFDARDLLAQDLENKEIPRIKRRQLAPLFYSINNFCKMDVYTFN